jgi:serine/threonine-protein kinase
MPLSPGEVVKDRYRIARLLGQGGMGAVYRAWDLSLNVPVALKEMIPEPGIDSRELAELREQFRREAQVLAGLTHPNLPRVTDFFEWHGNAYLVMDFVEGESLDELIARQGPVPEERARQWAAQLLDALAVCHARRIVHRDVKPQNIIIRPSGQAVLVDFGLVKLWDPRHPHTQRIIRGMGTVEYASPEHLNLWGRHTEPRSDLYSLGATLYHALTGREPPSAMERWSDPASLIPPRRAGAKVTVQTEKLVLHALELDIDHRIADAREMQAALTGSSGSKPFDVSWARPMTGSFPRREQPSPTPVPLRRDARWHLEMGTAMVMAALGVLAIQIGLFSDYMTAELYIGRTLSALVLGALGWFAGDLIFQAVAQPEATSQPSRTSRPTQRLVALTRRMARRLTLTQQIAFLVFLLVVATLLTWILAPPLLKVPFIYNYVQFYAVIGPLAYAATGRGTGRASVAHTLVVALVGALLSEQLNIPQNVGLLLLVAIVGGLLMEGVAFLADRLLLKRQRAPTRESAHR